MRRKYKFHANFCKHTVEKLEPLMREVELHPGLPSKKYADAVKRPVSVVNLELSRLLTLGLVVRKKNPGLERGDFDPSWLWCWKPTGEVPGWRRG